jgi:hypothetical protein
LVGYRRIVGLGWVRGVHQLKVGNGRGFLLGGLALTAFFFSQFFLEVYQLLSHVVYQATAFFQKNLEIVDLILLDLHNGILLLLDLIDLYLCLLLRLLLDILCHLGLYTVSEFLLGLWINFFHAFSLLVWNRKRVGFLVRWQFLLR